VVPKKIDLPDDAILDEKVHEGLYAKWQKVRGILCDRHGWRSLPQRPEWISKKDAIFLMGYSLGIVFHQMLGDPATPEMYALLKEEEPIKRFHRLFGEHPDEAAALFAWRREIVRCKNKSKQGLAERAIPMVRAQKFSDRMRDATEAERVKLRSNLSAELNATKFSAKDVVSYLDEKYGMDDWDSAVEDALRGRRKIVSGNKARRFPE